MAVYVVRLDDQVSAPAKAAGSSVSGLSEQFDALQSQLRAAEAALDATNIQLAQQANLARAAAEAASIQAQQQANLAHHDKSAYKGTSEKDILADIAAQQKKNLAMHDQNRDAEAGLAKQRADAHEAAITAARSEKMGLADLHAGYQMYGEAIDIVVSRFKALGAAIAATFALAIKLTQEDDALRSTLGVLAGGDDAVGQGVMDQLDALAEKLPFATGKLEEWAKGLLAAGVKGEALDEAIKAIAASTAIMGDSGGRAAEGLIKRFTMMAQAGQKVTLDRRIMQQLAEAGVTVGDLATALGVPAEKLAGMALDADKLGAAMQKALITKGVGPLQRMGQTFESMRAKILDSFEDAFANLGELVGPFMQELQSLASEFFKGGVASKDFAGIVKGLLAPAFEAATAMVKWLHLAFLEAQVAVLKFRVAILPVTSALDQFIPKGTAAKALLEGLKVAFIILAGAAVVFGVAMFIALLPLMVLVGVIGLVVYGLYRLGAVIYEQVAGFLAWGSAAISVGGRVVGAVSSTLAGIAGALVSFPLTAAQAGLDFVLGFVQAITSGQGPVADAARALARSALSAIKGALGISSPSRVMLQMGGYTAEGMAEGLEKGTPDVAMAAQGMGSAAVGGAAAGAGGGGGGRKIEVHVEPGAVVIHGAGGDVMALTEEALALLLEKILLQQGARA